MKKKIVLLLIAMSLFTVYTTEAAFASIDTSFYKGKISSLIFQAAQAVAQIYRRACSSLTLIRNWDAQQSPLTSTPLVALFVT